MTPGPNPTAYLFCAPQLHAMATLSIMLLILQAFVPTTSAVCTKSSCPVGYDCDLNTGFCRQFRQSSGTQPTSTCPLCLPGYQCNQRTGRCEAAYYQASPCDGVVCPSGFECDTNTGICRQFRTPETKPAISDCFNVVCMTGFECDPATRSCVPLSKCEGIYCPAGYSCDTNTGRCTKFRIANPTQASMDKCSGIVCRDGELCDTNTGYCRQFRTEGNCAGISCPAGESCDLSTGLCRAFRIASTSAADKCSAVVCSPGFFCDSNTGLCRMARQPTDTIAISPENDVSLCATIRCPDGMGCDSNTGECRHFRVEQQEYTLPIPFQASPPRKSKCGTCPPGMDCDENTGRCRNFRTPLRFAKLLMRYAELCKNVKCEAGFSCVSGSCEPVEGKSACNGIVCEDNEYCDSDVGKCVRFPVTEQFATDVTTTSYNPTTLISPTSTQAADIILTTLQSIATSISNVITSLKTKTDDPCITIKCAANAFCDSVTRKCVYLKNKFGSFKFKPIHPQMSDRCHNIICFEGMICDSLTGNCVPKLQIEPVNQCLYNRIRCNANEMCDPNSGKCIPNQSNELASTTMPDSFTISRDPCMSVNCPTNTRCDSASGRCVVSSIQPASSPIISEIASHHPQPVDLCWNVECPRGMACDSNAGVCRHIKIIQKDDRSSSTTSPACGGNCTIEQECLDHKCVLKKHTVTKFDLCANTTCSDGQGCEFSTGKCKPVVCPPNSHFVQCGSPCPFTCNHLDKCNDTCIPTCQCNDGYVQIRQTDVQCVLAAVCRETIDPCEEANDCDGSDICIDGICQPKQCPGIRKSPFGPGCKYIVRRRNDNCLQIDSVC